MRPRLHVRCLGEPLLLDHLRRPIRLRVRKHVALIFFLVLEPRHKATRERLRRLLWPDGNSAQSLSQAIVEIRRGLGPDIFDVTDHHLALRSDADITTDLQMLQTGAGELMVRELSQSFWSHVLFDGYEFEDADEWNDWLALERERWRERLGRLAIDVSHAGEWARHSADRQRLRVWGKYLLGQVSPRTIPRAEPPSARWDDVDLRVYDVDRLLPVQPPTALAVTGANPADAFAVVLAAIRHRENGAAVAVVAGGAAPAVDLARAILGLPGWVAASPEAVTAVQRVADGEPLLEAGISAMREVLDTVREEGAVVFFAPAAAPEMLQLLATIGTCSSTLRGLWLLVPDAGAALPHGGAHLAVEPASMDRMLEAAGRLAESDVGEAGLREALARSQGSLALLAVLLQSAARTTEHGVRLQVAAPSVAARTARLADATGLPPALCAALSSYADRAPAMLTHGWGAPNGASRSAPDRPSLVDGLPQALLWEDPSALLGRLEDAVDRGDASGRSVNAALLATRSRLGIANHEVVVDIIEERCQTSIQDGSQLEPAEALAYALMMSHARMRTAVSESTLGIIGRPPTGISQTAEATHSIAKLIIAQQLRDNATQTQALQELRQFSTQIPTQRSLLDWVLMFGETNKLFAQGRYAEARRLSANLVNAAHAIDNIGAFRLALGHQLVSSFRLGRYSETLVIAAAFGNTEVQSKAQIQGVHALLIAQAAVAQGSLRNYRTLRDAIEEHFICSINTRGLLLGAEFLSATGSHKRARQIAERALLETDATPLVDQQGLWAKWASRVLPEDLLDEKVQQMAAKREKVDARDQLLVYLFSKERGLRSTALLEEVGFHKHPLAPTAIA